MLSIFLCSLYNLHTRLRTRSELASAAGFQIPGWDRSLGAADSLWRYVCRSVSKPTSAGKSGHGFGLDVKPWTTCRASYCRLQFDHELAVDVLDKSTPSRTKLASTAFPAW